MNRKQQPSKHTKRKVINSVNPHLLEMILAFEKQLDELEEECKKILADQKKPMQGRRKGSPHQKPPQPSDDHEVSDEWMRRQ